MATYNTHQYNHKQKFKIRHFTFCRWPNYTGNVQYVTYKTQPRILTCRFYWEN